MNADEPPFCIPPLPDKEESEFEKWWNKQNETDQDNLGKGEAMRVWNAAIESMKGGE